MLNLPLAGEARPILTDDAKRPEQARGGEYALLGYEPRPVGLPVALPATVKFHPLDRVSASARHAR